jgi:hypothetical protein
VKAFDELVQYPEQTRDRMETRRDMSGALPSGCVS